MSAGAPATAPVLTEAAGGTLVITINRPEARNAVNLAVALNARGGPAIVLASVALDAHVIAERFYVDLVLLDETAEVLADSALGRGAIGRRAVITAHDEAGDDGGEAAWVTR